MAVPAPTRFSIKSRKTFTYRGGTKEWSNRYFFTDSPPSTSGEWLTMYNAIQALEKACFSNVISLIGGVGYEAGSEVPVWTGGATVTGTWSPGAQDRKLPGDCTRLIRFGTTQRTSKNHPIYLFKYYHGIYHNDADPADTPTGGQNTAFLALADALIAGISDGSASHQLCGPYGAVAQNRLLASVIGHRDFVN